MNSIRVRRAGQAPAVAFALWSVLAGGSAWAQRAEDMRLSLGQTAMVAYPDDITRVQTADPGVADLVPVSTRQIMVLAKGIGSTDVVIFTNKDQPMIYNVTVGLNIEPLRRLLRETFPAEPIEVRSSGDAIVLSGLVTNKDVMDRATALASVVAKNVVNNMRLPVAPIEKQVLLRVKFAELDRQRATDLGINLSSGAFNMSSVFTTGAVSNISGWNIHALRPDLNIEAFIKALENQSILQILAEPNLVTSNRQEASFLVGGEFPYPVAQGGATNAVTISFREFGIRLRFTPTITPNNTIFLALNQEVSTIDTTVGVSFNGTTIPGLSTRRADTKVELSDGQSFVVAGLMDNQAQESFQKIPFIGSVPILGTLFKSKSESKNARELVMLVTPMITSPLAPGEPEPQVDVPLSYLRPSPEDDLRGPRVDGKPIKGPIKKGTK